MKHPARFSPIILHYIEGLLKPERGRLLDPFAGTGLIHTLARRDLQTWGIEIEPEWAAMHPRTVCGDALRLPFPASTFRVICTSPTYGNRFADHHNAKDNSTRRSYTHDIGHPLAPTNSGTIHFGPRYKDFHIAAWAESVRVLERGGLMIVNVSDFIRKFKVVEVVSFHRDVLSVPPLRLIAELRVTTPRLRYGANSDARAEDEAILVATKEAA